MNPNKLDLNRFFSKARKHNYVIIKKSLFPDYYKGSDIDIFCEDMVGFVKLILEVGNTYVEQQDFEIAVTNTKDNTHIYVDFYINNELDFRFDLYSAFPEFRNLSLKKELFYDVLKNKTLFYSVYKGEKYPVYVPSETDDLLLHYIEYLEWYQQRPDKIKHLNYILEKISSDKDKLVFIDKLHNYTEFCRPPKSKNIMSNQKYILAKLKERILREIKKFT